MTLRTITLSGIDAGLPVDALVDFQHRYPQVEYAVLYKGKAEPRYPDIDWILAAHDHGVRFAVHVCGRAVRGIIEGWSDTKFCADVTALATRVQWNVGNLGIGARDEDIFTVPVCARILNASSDKPLIIQDSGNSNVMDIIRWRTVDATVITRLYDASRGNGVLAESWPRRLEAEPYVGYAGGLTPYNLYEQVPKILEAAEGAEYAWIDAETGLRTENTFDLWKAAAFVDNAVRAGWC